MEQLQPSLTRGEVSPGLFARVDTAAYQSAVRTAINFIVRPTGGMSNRAGTQFIYESASIGDYSAVLIPFEPSADSSGYLLEFYAGTVKISLEGADVATVATPYSGSDVTVLRYCQSVDVLTIFHPEHPINELSRIGPTTFALAPITIDDGPFLDENVDDSILVYASGNAGTVTLTATAPIFNADQVGGLFRLDEQDLSRIVPWEAAAVLANENTEVFGMLRRSDGKVYRVVTPGSTPTAKDWFLGNTPPTHTKGVRADGQKRGTSGNNVGADFEYVHSGYGVVRIVGYTSPTQVTATVISTLLPDSVVGGATTIAGPWDMIGDGVTTQLVIAGSSRNRNDYELTFDGVIQSPLLFDITADMLQASFYTPPANGISVSVRQVGDDTNYAKRTSIWAFGAWSSDQGYPSVGTYYGDRLVMAATPAQPQTEWASRVAKYHEFGKSVPVVDSDPITQTLNARQINAIRELVPQDQLISITVSASWASPQRGQAWTQETIGFSPQSFFGCASIRSIQTGDSVLFVEKNNTRIRDLQYSFEADKFVGNELTVLARHLFTRSNPIIDMDFQSDPLGILWPVRLDGTWTSCTYLKEQQVIGWGRHDTQGRVERVCTLRESGRDVTYMMVRRTIGAVDRRYVERMHERDPDDSLLAVFLDSSLTYDGRNTSATAVTLNGDDWQLDDSVMVASSDAIFGPNDSGDEIRISYSELDENDQVVTGYVRVRLDTYVSPTVHSGVLLDIPPPSIRSSQTTNWGFARDTFAGLYHLEDKTVGVQVDGSVGPDTVVHGGTVTLQNPGLVVHIGLKYVSDLETMDITVQGARMATKNVSQVGLVLQDSAYFKAGPDFTEEHLMTYPSRSDEPYLSPTRVTTDVSEPLKIPSGWRRSGRICIRQDLPAPLTILAVVPEFQVGSNG
jgi:hypothetical protein